MYDKDKDLCRSGRQQYRILAPSRREVPQTLIAAAEPTREHADLMFGLQMLRGQVYREYAGIAATLQPDGRHWHQLDDHSWHIVLLNAEGEAIGCARYRPDIIHFDQLICSKAAIALSLSTGPVFRSHFSEQLADAQRRGIHYGEASAWAMSPESRCSTAAVNIALMSFALAELLGGGMGLTTASTRHHASSILRRLGGSSFADFEPYYEPMFDCSIELLQFNVNSLNGRYAARLSEMKKELSRMPVLCPAEVADDLHCLSRQLAPSYLPTVATSRAPNLNLAFSH